MSAIQVDGDGIPALYAAMETVESAREDYRASCVTPNNTYCFY